MFCSNCGNQIPDGAKFCNRCGTAAEYVPEAPGAAETPLTGADTPETPDILERPTPNVQLCSDGVYRWFYSFDMLKNPTLLFTILNAMALTIAILFLSVGIIDLIVGNDFPFSLKLMFFFLLGALFMGLLAYGILALLWGGSYLVTFEMDEKGILHKQRSRQAKKVQSAAMVGLLMANSIGQVSAAAAALQSGEKYSSFSSLRTIKILRHRDTIKLNGLLNRNQVYALPEDYDFVLDYILAHVPESVKVKGG